MVCDLCDSPWAIVGGWMPIRMNVVSMLLVGTGTTPCVHSECVYHIGPVSTVVLE